jgi:hypothetical protein
MMETNRAESRQHLEAALEVEKLKNEEKIKEMQEVFKFKLAQQRSDNLPQCVEHAGLISHSGLREQWQFVRDVRVGTENIKVFLDSLADNDSEEAKELAKYVARVTNMLDLRLSAFNAAMNGHTYKKVELMQKYYAMFRAKVFNLTGKWASGELKFEDVQLEEAATIDNALVKSERDNKGSGGAYHKSSGAGGYSGGHSGGFSGGYPGGFDGKGNSSRSGAPGSGQAGKAPQTGPYRGGGNGGNGGKR